MNKCDSLKIFEEIAGVPRPSGKEEKIVSYLVDFATKYNLKYVVQDRNVIIYKDGTIKGNDKTIILQGHTDMVCEKGINSKINFEKDPIELIYDGDMLRANNTTLGADNGVGVALILHILKSKDLKHPNIEAVFTCEEETTMYGAKSLDYSLLKGKTVLSLDGTEEKELETASAGMVVATVHKDYKKVNKVVTGYKVSISNLKGGHSGGDIHLGRSNANKLLVRLLKKLRYPSIASIEGGDKDNAIPHSASVSIVYDDYKSLKKCVNELKKYVIDNNEDDKNVVISVKKVRIKKVYTKKDSRNIVKMLHDIENGVLEVNESQFPVTSQNLAKIREIDGIDIKVSLRSSIVEYETKYIDELKKLCDKCDYIFTINSSAPFFEEKKNSYIVDLCKSTYKKLYGEDIRSNPVHAGLEGGVFAQNIKDVDICVMAADLYDIHAITECASVSSIARVEKWLEKILEEF